MKKTKIDKKQLRALRTRKKIKVFIKRLRLSVFRSNLHIYAQIIDDQKGRTLVAASDSELKGKKLKKAKKAEKVGELLAKKALEKNIKEVVFDRGSYQYHGRVKALAEGARKGGLVF